MKITLQLVVCDDDGHKETFTDAVVLEGLVGSKNSNASLPQRLWTRHRLLLGLISL